MFSGAFCAERKKEWPAKMQGPSAERWNFQIRFEFYNLFNHPNFQNIQGDLSAKLCRVDASA
jgi:hypothetical protein